MAAKKKTYDLDLFTTLNAIDNNRQDYYNNLSDREKKAYAAVVLMRYMSSLPSQNPQCANSVLFVNDIVNVNLWATSQFPDLQHRLLCVCGIGGKQQRPWIAASQKKRSSSSLVDQLLLDIDPWMNSEELQLVKSMHDKNSIHVLALDAGYTEKQAAAVSKEFSTLV